MRDDGDGDKVRDPFIRQFLEFAAPAMIILGVSIMVVYVLSLIL